MECERCVIILCKDIVYYIVQRCATCAGVTGSIRERAQVLVPACEHIS